MDHINWHILNIMADDYETALIIQEDLAKENIDLEIDDIVERLNKLHSDGLLELMPYSKDKENKWYGMTESGRSIWDEHAKSHGYNE
jgi:hypothetical protein